MEGDHRGVALLPGTRRGDAVQPGPNTQTDVGLAAVDLLDVDQHHVGEVDGGVVGVGLNVPVEIAQVDLLLLQLRVAVVDDLRHEVVQADK